MSMGILQATMSDHPVRTLRKNKKGFQKTILQRDSTKILNAKLLAIHISKHNFKV